MTRLKLLIAPFAIATALAVPAHAQDSAIDVDGDGMYSLPEVQAVLPLIRRLLADKPPAQWEAEPFLPFYLE